MMLVHRLKTSRPEINAFMEKNSFHIMINAYKILNVPVILHRNISTPYTCYGVMSMCSTVIFNMLYRTALNLSVGKIRLKVYSGWNVWMRKKQPVLRILPKFMGVIEDSPSKIFALDNIEDFLSNGSKSFENGPAVLEILPAKNMARKRVNFCRYERVKCLSKWHVFTFLFKSYFESIWWVDLRQTFFTHIY